MSYFLQDKIKAILEQNGEHLDDISVIIPNKRASVYIQHHLASFKKSAFFSPEIITINEWINQHTPEKILNQQELIFLLFDVHKRLKQDENFDEFLKWGKTLLGDFDEIDRYLIDPKQLFTDLRNIKAIENWSFNDTELSAGQETYLKFWNELPIYYSQLQNLLHERGETYQGKAYQQFANQLEHLPLNQNHYYFLGFNALSASEEKIVSHLLKEKRATFFSDVDAFYFQNPEHEAGRFYRKLCERWQVKPEIGFSFDAEPKHIEIIESAQQTGQANICGEILNSMYQQKINLNSTAIVLADESLLIPLSQVLPANIGTANITMGYPLKYTHLKSLIDLIFDLQFNFQKFKNSKLYYKSLTRVLDHTYIAELISDTSAITAFEQKIIDQNRVFIDWPEITSTFKELTKLTSIFTNWENIHKNGFQAMHDLVDVLYQSFQKSNLDRTLELEMLYHFSKSFKKFETILNQYPVNMDLKSFKRMFYQFWQSDSLSFLGNPIEGVQIMGILETRLLDFENLIILGMNEGNIPQSNHSNSFIPYDLKKHHQLPSEEDKQALFAHHFYRLLHRAKNIFITYNSGGDDAGNSEKSRYITQLENELNYSAGHTLTHKTHSPDDHSAIISAARYASTKKIHEKLDHYFIHKGLSPSALNKLVNCPLDFYYRYILEMKENEQVEETIESSTFGTKIHDVLEDIFQKNFLDQNKPLDIVVLTNEKRKLEEYLNAKYLETFSESEIKYGQNKLSFEVSLNFLHKFLDQQILEIKRTSEPIFIVDLEKKLEYKLVLDINGVKKEILMSGLADRIDRIGNTIRIVDYKSGKCDDEKVVITKSWADKNELYKILENDKKGYARQLLMYACMFQSSLPSNHKFSAGIISMVNINQWLQNVRIGNDGNPILEVELLNTFEEELKQKIAALYHPDFYFEHRSASEYCEHCDV